MGDLVTTMRNNRVRIITIIVLAFVFFTAIQGMETKDWVITVLRGLSVGAITFLVASGLSLIFGLMDVLNLAHGEMFMLGAYVGWTVYVRPDTFIDALVPLAFLSVGLMLIPIWGSLLARLKLPQTAVQIWPWIALIIGLIILAFSITKFPIMRWDPEDYAASPISNALALGQGTLVLPQADVLTGGVMTAAIVGTLLGGALLGLATAGLRGRKQVAKQTRIDRGPLLAAGGLLLLGFVALFANDAITAALFSLSTTARFFVAMGVAIIVGLILGALVEVTMIRPLYDRPIYQLMITLGLSFIIIELVRAVWGRPEFTMPKPELWAGTGDLCPATSFGEAIANQCSTILLFDGRIRTYNEIFIIFIGVVVLVGIWLLLQRTRIGMIIRAGVQDSEMVEALGINVRIIFTLVFALGVALASLGGILAAPSTGLSIEMGTRVLLLALIALAIGGLTSFPGAAVGAVLVGLLQQFIIKYGSIGINLPFLAEPLKPSPPLVPASTVLLMVIILLILPNGLFGRSE